MTTKRLSHCVALFALAFGFVVAVRETPGGGVENLALGCVCYAGIGSYAALAAPGRADRPRSFFDPEPEPWPYRLVESPAFSQVAWPVLLLSISVLALALAGCIAAMVAHDAVRALANARQAAR